MKDTEAREGEHLVSEHHGTGHIAEGLEAGLEHAWLGEDEPVHEVRHHLSERVVGAFLLISS